MSSAVPTTPPVSPRQLRLMMFLITGAMFMEILDGSIIATALPAMAQSFGTSAIELNVGISAYLLALGVFIPTSGWVADRLGTRTVFCLAISMFTIASALCGLASSLPVFVGLRVLQGLSGAMMVPVGRLLVLRYTPKAQLMAAISALVWPALVAPVIGPPLGGFITTHLGWRWIFYLNVPLGVIGLIAALRLVPQVLGDERRPFDITGFALVSCGLFALLTGLERLPVTADAWGLGLLLAGLALLLAATRHFRRATTPLLSLEPFGITTFRVASRGGTLVRMAIGSAPFMLPLMFQLGFGYDAFHSGLLVLTVFGGNLAMKSMTTHILRRFGYRPVMLYNGALCMLALSACALISPSMPVAVTVMILVCSGMVRSMQFTTTGTIAYADMPKDRMADANGLFTTISQLTMAGSVTLGAICIRLSQSLAEALGWAGSGTPYRVAFLMVAAAGLLGLVDVARLPRGAGDHFVSRTGAD
jgi:EmrB/QacA subfamily drug resistance transporter